jgi:hypothetical protein
MNGKLFVALSLVAFPAASFTGLSAQARPIACSLSSNNTVDQINDDPGHLIAALNAKGIKVGSIENFGGCIRAYVTDANGVQVMAYFDPDTLQRIDVGGAAIGGATGNAGAATAVNPENVGGSQSSGPGTRNGNRSNSTSGGTNPTNPAATGATSR